MSTFLARAMPTAERSVYFATCTRGVEPVLHAEARELSLVRLERQVGGVRFEGTRADGWRANLCLRTAVRVLLRLKRFAAGDGDALYAAVHEVPWERWLAPAGSLAVQAQSSESALDHTQFLEQRVKDAVVDRFRARAGTRPSVDRDDPDLRVHLHLFRDRATLSLDTSGEPLHKRGWRLHQGRAPLAENLAAAVLRFSGWDGRAPLVDPFCGSGTLPIEAAWMAAGILPGALRSFGFERWLDHDARAYAALRAELCAPRPRGKFPVLLGSDLEPVRIEEARANAERAGVADRIRFELGDARELELRSGWNAWVVTNAPYGIRLGGGARPPGGGIRLGGGARPAGGGIRVEGEGSGDLVPLFRDLGARLRERGKGCTLALLAGSREHVRALGLRGLRRFSIVNGGLECVLAVGGI